MRGQEPRPVANPRVSSLEEFLFFQGSQKKNKKDVGIVANCLCALLASGCRPGEVPPEKSPQDVLDDILVPNGAARRQCAAPTNSTLHPALQTLSYEYHRATGLHRWQARTGSAKHFLLLPGFNQCVLLQYEYLIRFALNQGFSIDVLEYPGHGSKGGQLGHLNGLSADQLCRYVEVL